MLMKDAHPDLSGDDEESNEFCALVNEIYSVRTCGVQCVGCSVEQC